MSGTPARLTMRSGRLRSSIVSANDPLVAAATSWKPAARRAACRTARARRSGSISRMRGKGLLSHPRPRGHGQGLEEADEAGRVDRLCDVVVDSQLFGEVYALGAP